MTMKTEKNLNLNTKSDSAERLTSLTEANLGRRLLAAIIDFLLAVFVWFTLVLTVTTPIANEAMGNRETTQLGIQYQIASHLYVYQQQDDAGNKTIIEVKDLTEKLDPEKLSDVAMVSKIDGMDLDSYLNHLVYYYTVFKTGDVSRCELPNNTSTKTYDAVNDHFISPEYNVFVKDTQTLPKDYYTISWFNKQFTTTEEGKTYFDCPDENVLATIKTDLTDDAKTKCNLYLRNKIYEATRDFYYSGFYQNINSKLKANQVFIVLTPLIFTLCLIYLVPSMCFRNGETLAKKFLHIGLVSANGYTAKKRQFVLRFVVFSCEICLSLFIVGIGFTSIATLGLGCFFLLIGTMISKTHRSVHDYAAYTYVIDTQKSVWFDSKEDEESHLNELVSNMDRYRSRKVVNKNIIQVGDQIIDEQIKKEVEEANKKQ